MKLKSLKIKNFRGYQNLQIDFDSNLNVIIGKNDIGKSTILEALEIFFNNEKVKIEVEDLCVKASDPYVRIGVTFQLEPGKLYTIDTIPTSLEDEYLLNKDGLLEVEKCWDCSNNKLSASSLKTYLIAHYPNCFAEKPLVCQKNTPLKALIKEKKDELTKLNITVRENTNSEMRQALYKISEPLEFVDISIQVDQIEGKDIGGSLSQDYPLFFLFRSDRENKDSDKEVQDPLKVITKTILSQEEISQKLQEAKNAIVEQATIIGQKTIEKLQEMNPELGSVLTPDVDNKAWDSLFSFSFKGEDNIPINKRGSGVRRLILLSYFRAEAERKSPNNKAIIYAIEEPETSQHPNHQRLLIKALKDIAQKENHLVLMTTHSPEVAKDCKSENLILLDYDTLGNRIIIKEDYKLEKIAKTLGVTSYLSKLVLCVEGENDRNFLLNINQTIPELKNIFDLKERDVRIIPMGGGRLKDWVNKKYLEGSNVIEFHLYDKDTDDQYKSAIEKVNERLDKSIGKLTNKREMENYIHPNLYKIAFDTDFNEDEINIENWDKLDISKTIVQKTGRKEETIKRIANGELARKMTKEYFEDLNAYDEVKNWFEKMKELFEV